KPVLAQAADVDSQSRQRPRFPSAAAYDESPFLDRLARLALAAGQLGKALALQWSQLLAHRRNQERAPGAPARARQSTAKKLRIGEGLAKRDARRHARSNRPR